MLVIVVSLVACSRGSVAPPVADPDPGWELTVSYTAVDRYHDGPLRPVQGCLELGCVDGRHELGSYPTDFVDAVEYEGSGRITTGLFAGRYLNWSYGTGFWVDDAPRDSRGGVLVPFSSAGADADVLPAGTEFRVSDCGRLDDGSPVPADVCQRFAATDWTIVDELTPGFGGDHHVDLYVGDETDRRFTDSDVDTALFDAQLSMASSPTGAPRAASKPPSDGRSDTGLVRP